MPIQQVVPVDEAQLKPRHQRYSIDEGIDLNLYGIELEEPNMSVNRSISMSQPPGYIPQVIDVLDPWVHRHFLERISLL